MCVPGCIRSRKPVILVQSWRFPVDNMGLKGLVTTGTSDPPLPKSLLKKHNKDCSHPLNHLVHHLSLSCLYLQKRPVEDSDWRKNVEAMSGMEGRKKMFDAAKGHAQ